MPSAVTSLALIAAALVPLAAAEVGADDPLPPALIPEGRPAPPLPPPADIGASASPATPHAEEPVSAESIPVPERWRKPWTIDLRVLLGTGAPLTRLDFEDQDDELDVNAGTSGSFRVQTLWGYRPGGGAVGFQLGGGLALGGHGGDILDEENGLTYGYAALELTGGLLVVPTPGLQLEVRPFVRVGSGELDIDEDIAAVDEDDIEAGGYVAGGLTTGMWYAFGGGFQLGGEFGLEAFAGASEVEDETVVATGGGAFAALGLGYRW